MEIMSRANHLNVPSAKYNFHSKIYYFYVGEKYYPGMFFLYWL